MRAILLQILFLATLSVAAFVGCGGINTNGRTDDFPADEPPAAVDEPVGTLSPSSSLDAEL